MTSVKSKSTSGAGGLPDFQGFRAGTGLQDTIAKAFEEQTGDRAQGLFIFDQQDGFVAAGRLGLRRPVVQSRAGTFQGREVDSECGADANLTGHLDPTLVLLDNAIDGGEAQTGAFADSFCREEGFEDAGHVFRGNAGAGVLHSHADKHPGTGFRMRGIASRFESLLVRL